MRALVAALGVVTAGCHLDIDTPRDTTFCSIRTVSACTTAAEVDGVGAFKHQDFAWIYTNILNKNCNGNACHDLKSASVPAARLVFDQGAKAAYESLVRDASGKQILSDVATDQDIPLVTPNDPASSYLYFIMKGVSSKDFQYTVGDPPKDVGYMPRTQTDSLCCQKLDVIDRWITAGAKNDTSP